MFPYLASVPSATSEPKPNICLQQSILRQEFRHFKGTPLGIFTSKILWALKVQHKDKSLSLEEHQDSIPLWTQILLYLFNRHIQGRRQEKEDSEQVAVVWLYATPDAVEKAVLGDG